MLINKYSLKVTIVNGTLADFDPVTGGRRRTL